MLREQDLHGLYIPVVTPFLPDEQLDPASMHRYIAHLTAKDIQGIVINGTTGESPTVTWDEVSALFPIVQSYAAPRSMPIVVGTGTNSTAETVRRTELAGAMGADAVLVVTPYYSKPSQEGILSHYRRVAQVGVPVIAYEIPSRTGISTAVDTMQRILDLDGVIGLKDSSGGTALCAALTSGQTKPILCGEDAYFHAMLSQGASGGILASANVNTEAFLHVYRLAAAGQYRLAKQAFDQIMPVIQLLFHESNPSPLKWLLARQGLLASDTVRLPMGPVSQQLQLELEQAAHLT